MQEIFFSKPDYRTCFKLNCMELNT